LLGGGIEAMSITEVFGEFRCGKTQLSHTLCVTAQMPGPNGYMGGKVIFIDTEHTFRPDRLRSISERFNLDESTVLDNILYARAYNSEHQSELLNVVSCKLHEEAGVFKLLIVDSIMALFRVDYSGRGEIFDRQHKLGQMMSRLQKISEEYNIAIFITNQIASDFKSPDLATRPVGGNILAHASTTRIALKKGEGAIRIAKLLDSPDLEEAEAQFLITGGGIDDVKN
ncbi:hypothetical protein AMK59_6896, partial [Oryctes borbonicus]